VKFLRFLFGMTLIAGGCLTSRAVYIRAKAKLAGVLVERAWEHRVKFGDEQPPWPWADTHPVARLQIPRLGLDEIVLEGATPRTLAFGPARLLSGADFGEPGNLELAGHRTSWFLPLKGMALGDRIELQWYDARGHRLRERSYTVELIRVVLPDDVSLLAPTADDELTLVTCYPFGHSPHSQERYYVRASAAGPSRLSAGASGIAAGSLEPNSAKSDVTRLPSAGEMSSTEP